MPASYAELCDELFAQLDDYLEGRGDDLDYESNGAICEITLLSGAKVIINRQPPAQEVWLAAKSGGYHYRHDGSQWVDTRDGSTLFNRLDSCLP